MHIGYQQQTGSNVREMGQHFPYEESFCASTLNPLLWKGLLELCLNCWSSRLELKLKPELHLTANRGAHPRVLHGP